MLRLTNTMTGLKEPFEPINDPVRVYVCGVTPYSDSHVGHAMSAIAFDVIRRYLLWRGYRVNYVQNFTDIDDKIINRANERGEEPQALANRYIAAYKKSLADLNIMPADAYPLVTESLEPIAEIVTKLIDSGAAYVVDGDVYYRVPRNPRYGALSKRTLDDMMAGARVEIDERKEHPMDFAVWKSAKPGEPAWPSPWGPGRPGWHIECSAMCMHHLGDQIDIHGGGADLIFPHHENEIAQSESATHAIPFSRYWLHNGLLQLGKEKMSKSLGNLVTIDEALAIHSADAIRAFVIGSHYRAPLTWTDEGVEAAQRGVDRLRAAVHAAIPGGANTEAGAGLSAATAKTRQAFTEAMDDDFNSGGAFGHIYDLVREFNRAREQGAPAAALADAQATMRELTGVLGLRLDPLATDSADIDAKPFIDLLVEVRGDLRQAKQWALADKVRDRLTTLGVTIADTPQGATWRLD